jgi:cytochrome P450
MTGKLDLFDPAFRQDPYPFFAAHRAAGGLAPVDPIGAWLVTRYDIVSEILRRPGDFSSTAMAGAALQGREGEDGPPPMIITLDPPDHDRLRALVNRGFTPRRIGASEPRLRAIADDLFTAVDAKLAADGECDLMEALAIPFPLRVIAEMLGIEAERFEEFKRWSLAIVAVFGRIPDEAARATFEASIDALGEYLERKIEERRREPAEDLISVLVEKEEEDALTPDEVIGFCVLLLIAGNETTTNLVGTTVVALLENPAELEAVVDDPSLVPALVEEALRYASPVQTLFRQATRDVEIAGQKIPEGAIVMPSYAAANRDPERFPDPERFDVRRNTQGHLGFGQGIHFCLGAGLARLEARVVFEELIPRLAGLRRRDARVDWSDSPFLRGPRSLPLVPR